MKTVLKTRIIRIGNSRGIRIPKLLLDQLDLPEVVELEVQQNQLVIRPAQPPRAGWEDQFRLMAEQGDDTLLDEWVHHLTAWETDEWEWS